MNGFFLISSGVSSTDLSSQAIQCVLTTDTEVKLSEARNVNCSMKDNLWLLTMTPWWGRFAQSVQIHMHWMGQNRRADRWSQCHFFRVVLPDTWPHPRHG